jgi:hypothetical protein
VVAIAAELKQYLIWYAHGLPPFSVQQWYQCLYHSQLRILR